MKKPSGYVIYKGPSALDPNQHIIAVLTLKTSNAKTGDMAQLWILPLDEAPHKATKSGGDYSVCGNCPQRHYNGGACYVTVFQAPLQVWKSYHKGNYTVGMPAFNRHASVRLGAYGDPAALPYGVVEELTTRFANHTGYTHQLAHKGFDDRYLNLLQVSADTPKAALKAQKLGGKTFRVKYPQDGLLKGEIECLADTQGMTCKDCGICDGYTANVAITVHGQKAKKFKSAMVIIKTKEVF
jgi:hypothetical protein